MRYLLSLVLVFCFIKFSYASHLVVIDKSTEKIIMGHSDPNPHTALEKAEQDCISAGIPLSSVRIEMISDEEYEDIWKDQKIEERTKREKEKRDKEKAVKQQFGWTDEQFNLLKEALK